MKRLGRWLIPMLLPLGLSGCECGGEGYASDCLLEYAGDPEIAGIQFLNQMTDPTASDSGAVAVDLFVSTESEALFDARGFTTDSAGGVVDLELAGISETVSFDLRADDTDLTLLSNRSATLSQDTRYAVLAMGTFGRPDTQLLRTYPNEDQDPPDNRISIRLVNALAETLRPLELVQQGGTVIAQLGYGDDTGYVRLNPDDDEIQIDLRDTGGGTVATVRCPVREGETYLGVLGYAAYDAVANGDVRLYCHRR